MGGIRHAFALTALFLLPMAGVVPPQEIGKGLVVILVGAPGAGKSTQAAFIQKRYQIPVIAIEDLVRENQQAFKNQHQSGAPSLDLRMDQAIIALFKKKLESIDYGRGFVCDGFPASKEQADELAAMVREKRLSNPVVIQINVSDEEATARARKDPKADLSQLAQRLRDYRREITMLRSYYPEANVWEVDGAKTPREVSETINAILKDPEFDPPKN
jgi:adenylate kinase